MAKLSERLRKGRNWGGSSTIVTLGGVAHDTRMLVAADLLDECERAFGEITAVPHTDDCVVGCEIGCDCHVDIAKTMLARLRGEPSAQEKADETE